MMSEVERSAQMIRMVCLDSMAATSLKVSRDGTRFSSCKPRSRSDQPQGEEGDVNEIKSLREMLASQESELNDVRHKSQAKISELTGKHKDLQARLSSSSTEISRLQVSPIFSHSLGAEVST
uniref:Uncharacterized protein n=1 Tax=Guillardia theta TaxID=55529 RepID=A0A7S4NRC8_GUITH|mmetsp:Transcript_30084/g.96771  ORF Transcript_30084/g.96771 Transcript_30084/m.96771 type:complete len:122 (+) Transcript_30084:381-746(+)